MRDRKKKKYILFICAIIVVTASTILLLQFSKISYHRAMLLDQDGRVITQLESEWEKELGQRTVLQENIVLDSAIYQLLKDMKLEGTDEKTIVEGLNHNGWKIHTTIDSKLQNKLELYYSDIEVFWPKGKKYTWEETPQSSMVLMNYDGQIQALVGGNNKNTEFNRGTRELYQIGSTIKPVSIYGPLINQKLIHYSWITEDRPTIINVNGEMKEWPSNADGEYEGPITVAQAMAESKNTIPVIYGNEYGAENIYNYLDEYFYSTLVHGQPKTDVDMSTLALGYFKQGISMCELVGSYIPFGNGGTYGGTTIITKVEDEKGRIVYEHFSEERQVLESDAAYIMNRLLLNNVESEEGIAKGAKIEGLEVGGKTGTVGIDGNNIRKLFVGITPDYVAGIQYSYDNERPLPRNFVSNTQLWKGFMESISMEKKEFDTQEGVIKKSYCKIYGGLQGQHCSKVGVGYYTKDNMPDVCQNCDD